MQYEQMLAIVAENFSSKAVTSEDLAFFRTIFTRPNIISVLKDIVAREDLMQKICDRSYLHALGFDKLILIDLSKDSGAKRKNQLRLHIWEPTSDSLPIVESLHEHSFDFVSTVLTGRLENQRFSIQSLKNFELLEKINQFADKAWLNEQIECILAYRLRSLGSIQFQALELGRKLQLDEVQKRLALDPEQALELPTIQGHYVSNRVPGQRSAYQHILREYVALTPQDVLTIQEGQSYFHPYTLAHRLYYDNCTLNSTILLTTEVTQNPAGGSLQAPSYVQESHRDYDKISFSYERLTQKLNAYIRFLEFR